MGTQLLVEQGVRKMNSISRGAIVASIPIIIAAVIVPVAATAQTPTGDKLLQMYQETLRCPRNYPEIKDEKAHYKCLIEVHTRYGDYEGANLDKKNLALAEAIECHDKNKQALINEAIIDNYKCEIEVYTKYGVATANELAKAKKSLAREEEEQRESEERRKRCQTARLATIGMTEDQVIVSNWGHPSDRHTTTTGAHRREQWVYEDGPACGPSSRQSYLYFEDGILTAVQD
jgi:hypothetical protein